MAWRGRPRGGSVAVVLASTAGLCACTLLTDLGALDEGAADAPVPEAGSEPAARGDDGGGTANDADADAGADGGCTSLVCEDFDDANPLSRWQSRVVDGILPVPTIGVDTKAATSGASSFFLAAEPVHFGAGAELVKTLELAPMAALRCAFDLRIDSVPADGQYVAFAITAVDAPVGHSASFVLRRSGVNFIMDDVEGSPRPEYNGSPLPVGQWTRLVFTLVRAAPASFTMSEGTRTTTAPIDSWPATAKLALRFGMTFGNPYELSDAKLRLRYDTIRCDTL